MPCRKQWGCAWKYGDWHCTSRWEEHEVPSHSAAHPPNLELELVGLLGAMELSGPSLESRVSGSAPALPSNRPWRALGCFSAAGRCGCLHARVWLGRWNAGSGRVLFSIFPRGPAYLERISIYTGQVKHGPPWQCSACLQSLFFRLLNKFKISIDYKFLACPCYGVRTL